MEEVGCDGFNLEPATLSQGFRDFVDLVVPELQRRGRMRTRYEGSTVRELHFGEGRTRLSKKHVAHQLLPPWKQEAGAGGKGTQRGARKAK